jgi:hypothetical protein
VRRLVAVTALIPSLSRRSWRRQGLFAKLVRLSTTSTADETREDHRRAELGE